MSNEIPRIVLAVALCAAALPSRADPTSALWRCRQIADVQARVACYDAIPLPGSTAGTIAVPGVAATSSGASASAATVGRAGGPTAPPAAALAPAAAVAADSNFGLPAKPVPASQDAVESAIAGLFDGWLPNTQFILSNGQVWRIDDGSTGAFATRRDPKVRVTRGLLGSFFLEVEGVGPTPRVRRVR